MATKKSVEQNTERAKKTPAPAPDDVVRSVRLPKAMHKRLKQLAFDQEIDMQDFIYDALEAALKDARY